MDLWRDRRGRAGKSDDFVDGVLMQTVTERYRNDAQFRQLVDLFYSYIDHAQFTPSEIREAALLAHILYEERRIKPMIIDNIGEVLGSR